MTQTKEQTENQDKAERYLSRINLVEREIRGKRLELEALRYKASGAGAIRYDKDRVQTSPQDYMTMAIEDVLELEKQIKEDEESIEDIKGEAYRIVRQMKDRDNRALIEWFYLNGLSMTETAEFMKMSERNAYYVQDKALEEFGTFL